MTDEKQVDPVDKMVRLVFARMKIKYCTWWVRRINTPEKSQAEWARWRAALSGLTIVQVREGLTGMRRFYQFRPPTAGEFVRLVNRQERRPVSPFTGQRVDPVALSDPARDFFRQAKQLLK